MKGNVPITNQSICWTQELSQLKGDTLQLQSEGEHCSQPPANAPHLLALELRAGTQAAASSSCNTAMLDCASVQPDVPSIIQSRRISPAACTKQAQQLIQTRLLKALSQVLEALLGKPVQCGTEQHKPQDQR